MLGIKYNKYKMIVKLCLKKKIEEDIDVWFL